MADKPGGPPKAPPKPPASTVFEPSASGAGKAKTPRKAAASTVLHTKPPKGATGISSSAFGALSGGPAPSGGRIGVGSVLNHIYEVTRFIGRGGMGEVYEGINVNTDERVAIKVILPHLAQDPNVQAMFRKEARTLTRLSHPALVQYRVLAVEPQLGVLYIVTEFVDGVGLDEVIGELHPDQPALLSLMKRLAEGLRVAHELGAIHRDISPDNILLPNGRLEAATIIDFGIAKDLDSSHATIIGDGFAGKLGFVAPEQFGDFGREIGPWTDVYSLGLVMLAVAGGKAADMGTTLVEAVDRRRAGPDLTVLPDPLKPLFGRMLAPDPKNRARSMDEVLADIAALSGPPPAPVLVADIPPAPAAPATHAPPAEPLAMPAARAVKDDAKKPSPLPLIIAGVVAVLVLGGVGALVMSKRAAKAPAVTAAAADLGKSEVSLRAIGCAWIDAREGGDGAISLTGAGGPGWEGAAGKLFPGADAAKVLTLSAPACGVLDAVSPLRATASAGEAWVRSRTDTVTPAAHPECGGDAKAAQALADIRTDVQPGEDMALYLLTPTGGVQALFQSRDRLPADSGPVRSLRGAGPDQVTLSVCSTAPGAYGLLALRGPGPFPAPTGDASTFAETLAADAKAKGWRAQMDWYTVTPAVAAAPAVVAAPPPVAREPVRKPVRAERAPPKARPAKAPAAAGPPPAPKPPKDNCPGCY